MNIGDTLHTSAEREAAPIGAVIFMQDYDHSPADTWTKTAPNLWVNGLPTPGERTDGGGGWMPDGDPSGYVVQAWPVPTRIYTAAERASAPIGARIHGQNLGTIWVKTTADLWTTNRGLNERHDVDPGWYYDDSGNYYTVDEWPTASTPGHLQVGDPVSTTAQFDALPVGTVVHLTSNPDDTAGHRVKSADGAWPRCEGTGMLIRGLRTGGYFTVRSLPNMAQPVAEAGVVGDYAALLDLPVGSVFFNESHPLVRWAVGESHSAVREGDPFGVIVALDVFEGPANAGVLRIGEAAETVEAALGHPQVGEMVTEREHFDALPVGTVLRHNEVVRTKRASGDWSRPAYNDATSRRMRLNYFTVVSLPQVPVVALPAVGETVQTREQMAALPMGTRLRHGSNTWTKRESGWCINDALDGGSEDQRMTVPNYNTVEFLPGVEPVVRMLAVGDTITIREQLASLPLGTAIIRGSTIRTLVEGGWQRAGGSTVATNVLSMTTTPWVVHSLPESVAVPEVGTELTSVAMFDALPVGTLIRWSGGVERTKSDDGLWFLDGDRDGTTANLLTMEGWHVVRVGPQVMVVERDRAVADAVAAAVAARDEEFLSELRGAWDGVNFQPSEINEVLSNLGLESIDQTEEVTVTVTVTGSTTLHNSDVEDMIEGSLSARLISSVTAEWTMEGVEIEDVETATGCCACDVVDTYRVRTRLEEDDVEVSNFTYTATCPNC